MTETTRQENKMGVMPVSKLLFQMSLPMMISMLVQALYNVVDSVFVAQINEAALTAVSLAFPLQNFMIAISVGTGVGVNALLSRNLGEKNFKGANMAASNGVFLAIISSICYAAFGLLISGPFLRFQTDDAQILLYGEQYLMLVTGLCFSVFLQVMMERLLQATGKTFYTMLSQGLGAIVNIILDPILIFGLGPFPRMEVAGAAIATLFGQLCGFLLSLYFNLHINKEIHISLKKYRPDGRIIRNIYSVGLPSIVMQAIGSLMTFGMNKILINFTSTATAVFGVYFKLQSFIFMPVFGLNNGLVPIVAYNYGARNKKRMTDTIRLAMISAVVIMLVGLAVFNVFPRQLLGMFNASEEMLTIGVAALRIISLAFPLAAFGIVTSSVFQALDNAVYSMIISLCRQLIVLLPVAYLLGHAFGLTVIWWAFPIAELVSVTLSVIFYIRIYRKKIALIGDEK